VLRTIKWRCTYCGNAIPWPIPPADLGLRDGEVPAAGRPFPYERCTCGYGKFVVAEGDGAEKATGAAPNGIGLTEATRRKIEGARYHRIPLAKIHPNPKQPRKFFDAEALRALADSIKAVGLLEDILVRPSGDGYEIVLGERRWRASQLAGVPEISAKIADLSDDEVRVISLTENLHREDLTGVEEAFSFKAYVDQGKQLTEIGSGFGGMEKRVAEKLKLLNSHYYVQFQEERIERLQQLVDALRDQARAHANGRYEARVVPTAELEARLAEGFDVAAVLPDGRVAIRRRMS
jgi:ParB/RepB/Spo0J family partition protein